MLDRARLSIEDDVARLQQLYASNLRARYRHTIRRPKGNLYYAIRQRLGLSQHAAGRLLNISRQAWQYRERSKVMYWPLELCVLQRLAGMNEVEFIKLLNDIA